MVSLCGIISRLEPKNVLVVGDLIVDRYTVGHAKRISPEAPVAVVNVTHEEQRPGGSGNVILNFRSLGANVKALGRVGDDAPAHALLNDLSQEQVDVSGIHKDKNSTTPLKNRIIAGGQQIVRVDHEVVTPLSHSIESSMIAELPDLLQDIDVVAISDYGKGCVTPNLLKHLIQEARKKGIPVIADPKGTDFTRYSGVTILKPNLGEAYAAAGCSRSEPLEKAAAIILDKVKVDVLMVTRSEEGISLFYADGKQEHFTVEAMEVKDVTGAGDTVLAIVAYAIANGLSFGDAAQLANVAASIAISQFGCARVSLAMLSRRLLEKDIENKVFEEKHLFALQETLKGQKFIVLGLSLQDGLQAHHFETIQKITEKGDKELVLFIRDPSPSIPLVKILASLHQVNYIIVNGEDLQSLCRRITPDEVYVMEASNDIKQVDEVHVLCN